MYLPRKCGKLYIKFDDNKEPEYGYEVINNQIVRFIPLTDKEITIIILPKLVESSTFTSSGISDDMPNNSLLHTYKTKLHEYITGRVKICRDCFKGISKAKIVVPFENSVMLDWGCFDENAEIELIIPKNLTLKQIHRRFDTGFDYEHENWTVISDERVTGEFTMEGFGRDQYSICEYIPEELPHTVANFTITKPKIDNIKNNKNTR